MKRFYQLANIVSLAFALIMNFLVGAQILNVPSIGEISDKYATLLTPATYAFSIWSLIYILLIVFAAYQARDFFKPNKANDLPQKVGPWFIIASVCNGLWTFIFVQEWILVSVAVILLLAVSLYRLIWKLNIANFNATPQIIVCVWWPLLIYAGWVTAASVVNIASYLASLGVSISPVAAIAVLVVLAAGLLALLVRRNARELVLATAWAIVAVGVNQIDESGLVGYTALLVPTICVVAVAIHGFMYRESNVFYRKLKQ